MPCKADAASVEWITDDDALAAAAGAWGRVIGLDTEFQRTDTFFPLPGLYQVSDGSRVYLLDPLSVNDFSPLLELLEDRRVVKIMHSCSEDLELLRHHFGAAPVGLFDTQLAHAFVSTDFSISFTRLVEARLGVTLDQQETRSDWLARPLTAEQVKYAAEDVYYLPPLYEALHAELVRTGRLAWFREEMDERGRFQLGDPDTYYLGMNKVWRMDDAARARLQRLTSWRERQAMAEDRPRNRIVRDEHLLALAEDDDVDTDRLQALLPRGVVRRYGDDLLAAHDGDSDAAGGGDPPPQPAAPLTRAETALAQDLRVVARAVAESLGMAPELLSRKKDVEACVRHFRIHGELSERFLGWRAPLLADAFRARLAGAP
ncbi:MAG: ribonuclease D [Pseudomonadales bacterium]